MKTILRFAFGFTCMLLLFQNVKAQDTVTVSAVGDTTWFSLESACTVPQTLGGAYTGPADLTGYVLYDGETGDNRIYARPAEDTEDELWALIPSGDDVFLMNKLTGRFMNQSHSLGDAGEAVEWGTYGDNQFWFNCVGYTQIVIWNDFKCDRIDNGGKDANTAYYVMNQQDTTTSISYRILDQGNEIRAWSRYGIIYVEGTDAPYDIYTITGRRVRKNTKLQAGLYIVATETKSVKVVVSH